MQKLLTIIVTYNAMRWVDRCIGSVMSSTIKSDIFIIDNGSTDGTREYIAKHYPEAIFVKSDVNLKFGRANNIGIKYALNNNYDYVYLLNQDAWVAQDTFERLLSVACSNSEYGILSPIQFAPDWETYETMFKWLVVNKLPIEKSNLQNLKPNSILDVQMVQAAHWMISRKCIEIIGGFSPSFPHYGEDENYCHRVLFHGFQIGIVPAAKCVHDASNKPLVAYKQKKYKFYIHFVVAISNVNEKRNILSLLFYLLRRAKGFSVEHKSLASFGGYFKALSRLPLILHNRDVSIREKCAFLNLESLSGHIQRN